MVARSSPRWRAAQPTAMMAAGGKIRLPPPEVCEKTALQYGCNRGEPAGVDEWPHWARMMDQLDPSYRS